MALWGGRFTQAADKRFKRFLMIACVLIIAWQSKILKAQLVGLKL